MGFHEFGQSLLGMTILGVAMLVAFGGYQNQELYSSFLPEGVSNPNDINNSNIIVSSSQGTPYATPTTGSPGQDNNPILNLIFNQIGAAYKLILELPGAIIDALSYIGLPPQVSYPIIVLSGVLIVFYAVYFIAQVGVGAFAGFFK